MKAPVVDTGEPSVLAAPQVSVAGSWGGTAGEVVALRDRRTVRHSRLRERRVRRLYALGGLAVLVAVLIATVIVVDMVR
jgi:hypothetical protein